jgi:hypothetical protein
MTSPNWLTLSDLAAHLGLTEAELLTKRPEAEKTLAQIQIDITAWAFPNRIKGREKCAKQAGLCQWDYMETEAYGAAILRVSGMGGFRIGDFSVQGGDMPTGAAASPNLMGPLTRQVLLNCGLLCRATACGVVRC